MHKSIDFEPVDPGGDQPMDAGDHGQADGISPDVARRKASGFLVDHVGNLLHAEQPLLLKSERFVWQMQIALTSPRVGLVGYIGSIRVDVSSGKVIEPDETVSILARHLAVFALRSRSNDD